MGDVVRSWVRVAASLIVLSFPAYAAEVGSIEGRWKLVEQTYGAGASNLVAPDEPGVHLEFTRRGLALDGELWAGDRKSEALAWPNLLSEDVRQVDVDEKRVAATEDHVRVRYRVGPSPGDDLTLHVTEEYRVVEHGQALVGRVEIEFNRNGKPSGSYTLHRRFERQH